MNFTKIFLEKNNAIAFRGKKRALMNYVCNHFEENKESVEKLNKALFDSIKNQENRSEIIEKLVRPVELIFNETSSGGQFNIDAEWVYMSARHLLPGREYTEGDKTYIIGARRGQDGGFTQTLKIDNYGKIAGNDEIIDSKTEDQIEEEIAKTLEQQEIIEKDEKRLEKHYYPMVQAWARNNGFERCEITGGMLPGPKWENPDLIEIYAEAGKNTVSISIEVTCFEVKLKIDPYAVWQAAHYKKFSTYTFIAFAISEHEVRDQKRIFDLAISLGLGVLVLDNGSFKAIHYPTRNAPEISEIEVIASRFADKFPDTLRNQIEGERLRLASLLLSGISLGIKLQ